MSELALGAASTVPGVLADAFISGLAGTACLATLMTSLSGIDLAIGELAGANTLVGLAILAETAVLYLIGSLDDMNLYSGRLSIACIPVGLYVSDILQYSLGFVVKLLAGVVDVEIAVMMRKTGGLGRVIVLVYIDQNPPAVLQ